VISSHLISFNVRPVISPLALMSCTIVSLVNCCSVVNVSHIELMTIGSVHILRHQGWGEDGQGSDDADYEGEGVHGCDDAINIFALAVILTDSTVTIKHLVVS